MLKTISDMRILLMLIPLFFTTFCQSVSTTPEPTASAAAAATPQPYTPPYQMKPDTILIRGKFLSGCTFPASIKIALHNVDNTFWKDVTVTNGEFNFKHYLTEPRRVAIRTMYGVKFDFFATTDEKTYDVEINCATRQEVFTLKGSAENEAYLPFNAANKKLQTDLDSLGKKDISQAENFALVQQTFTEYQKTLKDIVAKHPNTFTAKVFCAADLLPDDALNSLGELRKAFLQREAFANPQYYNDFAPQRILINYLPIRDKQADATAAIETLMAIGMRNPEAAKRLQDNMNNIFYKMHQEDLVIAFINWAERNPDKMYNASVKSRLQNLKKVVAGSQMIDFELKDPTGKLRKLSETVKSGKLTVLIFYSPTCGHCKEKVPELIPLWEKYKNKGLKIYAAGSNAKPDEWNTFINKNASPEWVHVFEYENEAHPSDSYYAAPPTFILIDGQGKIVSRIGDLEHVIEEIEKRLL